LGISAGFGVKPGRLHELQIETSRRFVSYHILKKAAPPELTALPIVDMI
jgi:hypothetical protein